MAKKNAGTRKSAPKKATRKAAGAARTKGEATTKRALRQAGKAVDANLKAIAAADQENARKRDDRAASPDGIAASERAMAAAPKRRRRKEPDVKAKRTSGLSLAAQILVESKEPLNAKEIAARAIAAGWKTSGKTPEATLYAAIIREIARKGSESRFRKADRGMFAPA